MSVSECWEKLAPFQLTSGQNQMPQTNGTAGMKAEPSCSLHAILPTSLTAKFAPTDY